MSGHPIELVEPKRAANNPQAAKKRAKKKEQRFRQREAASVHEWLECARYGELGEMIQLLAQIPQVSNYTIKPRR